MLTTHAVEAMTRCRDGAAVARARSGVRRLSRDGGAVVVVKVLTRCDGQRSRSVPIQDRCRCRDVQGSLVGWVLRSELQPALRGSRQGWGEDLAVAI